MKVSIVLLCAALTIFSPATVYAAQELETDMFGNPIDWDQNAVGGEEQAGLETDGGSAGQKEPETYSFQEQVDILKEMEQYETTAPTETGFITVSLADMEDDWSQENIKVELSRGNASEEIWLYRQSGWAGREELPIGHYTFYRAQTADGAYQFSCNKNSFDISHHGNVSIALTMGVSKPDVSIIPETISKPATPSNGSKQDKQEQSHLNKGGVFFTCIAIIVFIGLFLGIKILPKRKEGYRNDLLD